MSTATMKTYKVVRRESPPIEAEAHRVLPPQPPGEPKPALDAYVLLALWRRARMSGDRASAFALLSELERLAQRPSPRAEGGDRDGTDD